MIKQILLLFIFIPSCCVTLLGQNDDPVVKEERMPTFPGGEAELMKFIHVNLKMPAEAKKKGVTGSTHVEFVVDTMGQMKNIHIKEGRELGYGLDEEAIRVVTLMSKNYTWSPAIHEGRKVSVTFTLPVSFKNFK